MKIPAMRGAVALFCSGWPCAIWACKGFSNGLARSYWVQQIFVICCMKFTLCS
jgi:hypothetical protein